MSECGCPSWIVDVAVCAAAEAVIIVVLIVGLVTAGQERRRTIAAALAAADEVAPPDARIEALEAALRDAKVCIVNYSNPKESNKVAEFLVGIDIALGNDTVPRPRSCEAQARIEALEAERDTELGEHARTRKRIEALKAEVKSLADAGEREAVAWGERDQYLRTNVNLAIEIKDARKRIEALEAALRDLVADYSWSTGHQRGGYAETHPIMKARDVLGIKGGGDA